MAGTNLAAEQLSETQRQQLEALLVHFERSWDDTRLAVVAGDLPATDPYRIAALAELAKVDLERRWQTGDRVQVERYLDQFPELASADPFPMDLVEKELEERRRHGEIPDSAALEGRFPGQAALVRRLVAQGGGATSDEAGAQTTVTGAAATDHPARSSALPEHFGRYRIIRPLGRGGMGTVYLAHDTQLDRQVALKVPRLDADRPQATERFYREARAAAAFDHPNLCPVYDVGQVDGIHYLTMPVIEGQSLAAHFHDNRPTIDEAVALVRKLALALVYAHGRGVIHRDLKPANVMLKPSGEPVVMDFGLARRADAGAERITQSGAVLGTPAYMSPEQVEGRFDSIGTATDIYSLGVMLYEMVTHQLPFQGSAAAILGHIVVSEPRRPSALRPEVSLSLEAIVMKAMAKRVPERYARMEELATALESYQRSADRGSSMASTTVHPTVRHSTAGQGTRPPVRWLRVATGAAAVLLLASTVIVIKTKDGQEKKVEVDGKVDTITVDGKQVFPATEPKTGTAPGGEKAPPSPIKTGVAADPELAVYKGHKGAVSHAVFSPDAKTIVSTGEDGTVRLWDVASGKAAGVLSGHAKDVHRPAFSRDGKLLATVGNDGTLRIWDPAAQKQLASQKDPAAGLQIVVFAPDGKTVATGNSAGLVTVWDAASAKEIARCEGHARRISVNGLAFSPDGKLLVSGSEDGTVRLWNPATGKRLATWQGFDRVVGVQITPDGKNIVAGDFKGKTAVWGVEEAKEIAQFFGLDRLQGLAVSPDGRFLACCSDLGLAASIGLWASKDWRKLQVLKGRELTTIAFAPNSELLASADRNGVQIALFRVKADKLEEVADLQEHTKGVSEVSFSPDGKLVVSASGDGTVRLWDVDVAIKRGVKRK